VRLEGLGKLKKCNVLIGNRTGDLPACASTKYAAACPRVLVYHCLFSEVANTRSLDNMASHDKVVSD
jgi:hypothetical protein